MSVPRAFSVMIIKPYLWLCLQIKVMLTKDYIFMPIHRGYHYSLIVICMKAFRTAQVLSFHFDSLNEGELFWVHITMRKALLWALFHCTTQLNQSLQEMIASGPMMVGLKLLEQVMFYCCLWRLHYSEFHKVAWLGPQNFACRKGLRIFYRLDGYDKVDELLLIAD